MGQAIADDVAPTIGDEEADEEFAVVDVVMEEVVEEVSILSAYTYLTPNIATIIPNSNHIQVDLPFSLSLNI